MPALSPTPIRPSNPPSDPITASNGNLKTHKLLDSCSKLSDNLAKHDQLLLKSQNEKNAHSDETKKAIEDLKNQILNTLNNIDADNISLEELKQTRIGAIVNKIRKSIKSDEIQAIVLKMLKIWRRLMADAQTSQNSTVSEKKGIDAKNEAPTKKPKHTKPELWQNVNEVDVNTMQHYQDTVRTKFVQMIHSCFFEVCKRQPELQTQITPNKVCKLALKIEQSIFENFSSTVDNKYKAHMRSKILALRGKCNPELFTQLFNGLITPASFASMETKDLAPDSVKKQREILENESIENRRINRPIKNESSLLKCPRCKKNNCTYTQMQTRSADEPMTNFCFCGDCGYNWRFS